MRRTQYSVLRGVPAGNPNMSDPVLIPFPTVRRAFAWLVLLGGLAFGLHRSWHYFDVEERRDGNDGHVRIDFGGQWLMGRLLVEGHARRLYDREAQRDVLRRSYPASDGAPGQQPSDAENLLEALIGSDSLEAARAFATCAAPLGATDALSGVSALAVAEHQWTAERLAEAGRRRVGGPLYPPVNAFLQAPLALLPPRAAYRAAQLLNLLHVFACGALLVALSGGRVWWPVAVLLLTMFPGFGGCLNLGQNATLSLAILLLGWLLLARGREGWAGAAWGLLAFKPIWAAAFFLVPLLTGRWRMALAMLATGTGLALATLPVVGAGTWLDWLRVGGEATAIYAVDRNWIDQSRDLLGAGRRWMLDFDRPVEARLQGGAVPALVGWGLLLAVLATTATMTLSRRREARAIDGPAPAFVLLGVWLSCYHFMYYDVLLAALPVALLFLVRPRWTERSYWLGSRSNPPAALGVLLVIMPNVSFVLPQWQPRMQIPWDQYLLTVLWLWCGWSWLRAGRRMEADTPLAAPEGLRPCPKNSS